MSQLSDFSLKKAQSNPLSKEAYKRGVSRAVELLVSLGIMDTKKTDLKSSVKEVIQKLEKNEEVLYGKKLNKQEIREELKQVNSEIADLELQLSDIKQKIQINKLSENAKNINLDI
jgi:predicted  nucleic acid-binding Zn-ribbon protein